MRCSENPGIKCVSLFTVISLFVLLAASVTRAEGYFYSVADTTMKGTFEVQEEYYQEAVGLYQYFSDEGMSEAYTHCYGLMYHWGTKTFSNIHLENRRDATTSKSASRGEIGLIFASGEPLQTGSDYIVENSSLGMVVVPLQITFLHLLSDEGAEYFEPYFGVGLGGFFGFERIVVNTQKDLMVYDWHDTCYRHSFGAHILLGANKKVSERIRMVFEVRWTQAGKGRLKRAPLSEEELTAGWGEVFQDFQHPQFNFTGVSINIGFRW